MISTGRRGALIGGVALTLATSVVAGPTPERVLRAAVAAGPNQRLAAASFFGGAGAEAFSGVLRDADGAPIAYGNAWSGPFSGGGVEPAVLGPDEAHGLPLFSGWTPANDLPHDILPSAHHPDRTGFLIRYSNDLRAIEHAARFGWGAATIDAAADVAAWRADLKSVKPYLDRVVALAPETDEAKRAREFLALLEPKE